MIPVVLARLLMRTHVSGRRRFENFIGGREFENIKADAQMGKWILRAMPMKIAGGSGGPLRIAVIVPRDQPKKRL
jgi:kynurenine formamidase